MFISVSSIGYNVKVKGQGHFSISKWLPKCSNCNNSKTVCQRGLKLSPNALECQFPSGKYTHALILLRSFPFMGRPYCISSDYYSFFFCQKSCFKVLQPIGLKFGTLDRLFQE